MKVLVCGGRHYDDFGMVAAVLGSLGKITHIIHGAASGADALAGEWARLHGAQEVRCPANWGLHGKAAGPIRNAAMLALAPQLVIAFPGGAGTKSMVTLARATGVDIHEPA